MVLTQIKAEDAAKSAEEAKEKAEKEVANLRKEKDILSVEISKLPQEANRLYLMKQLEALARGLTAVPRSFGGLNHDSWRVLRCDHERRGGRGKVTKLR